MCYGEKRLDKSYFSQINLEYSTFAFDLEWDDTLIIPQNSYIDHYRESAGSTNSTCISGLGFTQNTFKIELEMDDLSKPNGLMLILGEDAKPGVD